MIFCDMLYDIGIFFFFAVSVYVLRNNGIPYRTAYTYLIIYIKNMLKFKILWLERQGKPKNRRCCLGVKAEK